MSFWNQKEAKSLFQELPFYIFLIENPKIRDSKNIDLLQELSFYDELSIYEMSKTFGGMSKTFGWYARSYKVEIVVSKDPLAQLEASKSSIKDLFKDLLDEIKGFKYQITVKMLLKKDKQNGDIEFDPVYFNSTTKTVINFKYYLDKSFQEVLHRIDNWINKGSG